MKKWFFMITLSLLMMFTLAACGSSDEGESTSGDTNDSESTSEGSDESSSDYKLVEDGKFTFAASGEFRPFSMTNASGEMTGFDIDVANAVAKELGLEPVQQKQKFASIVEGV
ncbi:transporter substrate-binding domain-containing protein, partial [Halobacillus sp. BBL2006]|uniref:transporter substrate-binding domain-containing protein n=1 Tax=Halobacillus sp. BBL2006 TaxID=1543706 RepID=UPI000541BA3B